MQNSYDADAHDLEPSEIRFFDGPYNVENMKGAVNPRIVKAQADKEDAGKIPKQPFAIKEVWNKDDSQLFIKHNGDIYFYSTISHDKFKKCAESKFEAPMINGKYAFVVLANHPDTMRILRIPEVGEHEFQNGLPGHTSMLTPTEYIKIQEGLLQMIYAGTIKIEEHKIIEWTNYSGHFHPNLQWAMIFAKHWGLSMKNGFCHLYYDPTVLDNLDSENDAHMELWNVNSDYWIRPYRHKHNYLESISDQQTLHQIHVHPISVHETMKQPMYHYDPSFIVSLFLIFIFIGICSCILVLFTGFGTGYTVTKKLNKNSSPSRSNMV